MRAVSVLLSALGAASAFNPDQRLDRPRTLSHADPRMLEAFRQGVLRDTGRMSFSLPLACADLPPGAAGCGGEARRVYRGPDGEVGLGLVLAEEFRRIPGRTWATEAGGVAEGGKDGVSFRVDARAFVEGVSDPALPSFDGDIVDVQEEDRTGSISYRSYARFRGHMALDTRLGRFRVARDAAHWGPGLRANLAMNQEAVPYNHITFQSHLGPFTVTSLYADLLPGRPQTDKSEKSLYAHRYEWRATRNLLVGITEQLFLVGTDKPYLFTPVFPLFVAKSFMHEHSNNGNLAVDASYRWGGRVLAYAEVLLDDLESPSSLFLRDYRQNKWAFMAGVTLAGRLGGTDFGLTAEYSRLEPWVYTHFIDYPAQASHLDAPLGNPFGPNSQAVLLLANARPAPGLYLGLGAEWIWKGADEGSGLFDPYEGGDHFRPKEFIAGADAEFTLRPSLGYRYGPLAFNLEGALGRAFGAEARVSLEY